MQTSAEYIADGHTDASRQLALERYFRFMNPRIYPIRRQSAARLRSRRWREISHLRRQCAAEWRNQPRPGWREDYVRIRQRRAVARRRRTWAAVERLLENAVLNPRGIVGRVRRLCVEHSVAGAQHGVRSHVPGR